VLYDRRRPREQGALSGGQATRGSQKVQAEGNKRLSPRRSNRGNYTTRMSWHTRPLHGVVETELLSTTYRWATPGTSHIYLTNARLGPLGLLRGVCFDAGPAARRLFLMRILRLRTPNPQGLQPKRSAGEGVSPTRGLLKKKRKSAFRRRPTWRRMWLSGLLCLTPDPSFPLAATRPRAFNLESSRKDAHVYQRALATMPQTKKPEGGARGCCRAFSCLAASLCRASV
jgi:hypothetical protein